MAEIRIVFDSNVYLQSLLNPQSIAAKCFQSVKNRKARLFVSKATLDEFRDVIFRPNILSKIPDLNLAQIENFIKEILSASVLIKNIPAIFKFKRDPKDEFIINLAAACKADYIISRDNNTFAHFEIGLKLVNLGTYVALREFDDHNMWYAKLP